MRVILTGNKTLDALTVRGAVFTHEATVIAKAKFEDAREGVASKVGQVRRWRSRVRGKAEHLRRRVKVALKGTP